jgi:superfamily II DNA or RNA helicase
MTATLFDLKQPRTRAGIRPRDYQLRAHDDCLRLFDQGTPGVLMRMATGTGKTLTASLVIDTWLRRSEDHRAIVISYETQLVEQFADEIHDSLGIKPGIEMELASVSPNDIPRVVVASRASLLRQSLPTPEQIAELAEAGITDLGATTKQLADTYLRHLREGGDAGDVVADIVAKAKDVRADGSHWSRVHKFPWQLPWLVIFDEAHRHAWHLRSVGHIADWFGRNAQSRRLGLTATPKRGEGVSIGDKMFPGVAIDYPLHARSGPSALSDGWAVPYVQRYIEVEGVDFRSPHLLDRNSQSGFDDDALAKELEQRLASFVLPMLDLVGDRRTLIFSVNIEMAKQVANFINVRCRARCSCGADRWHPKALIGDGATCPGCRRLITAEQINKDGPQARELDGSSPKDHRREIYRRFAEGEFQFLSVCGLCREGFNDPGVAAVAVFRPVSKKASSLAEQMKGRSCRPPREVAEILRTLPDAEARRKAIAESAKPHALIIDLVGITGLGDCASTVEIYADGLPDEVKALAEKLLAEHGKESELDVETVIDMAEEQVKDEHERITKEREAAEARAREEAARRSRADAQAHYTTHEAGTGAPGEQGVATEKQLKYIASLGIRLKKSISRRQAGRIIDQLLRRTPLDQVAYQNGIAADEWAPEGASPRQMAYLNWKEIDTAKVRCRRDASELIKADKQPAQFLAELTRRITTAGSSDELHLAGLDLGLARAVLSDEAFLRLVQAGKERRRQLGTWE